MQFLIDGYNLMYAGGLLGAGKRLGPDGFRKVRSRFLNDLASTLGPLDAHQTTVVFDASHAPDGRPREMTHQGMSVVYAVDDDDADARLEALIAHHPHPKTLTVVSTDRRVRQAASRRKARAVTAEAFWTELDARKRRPRRSSSPPPEPDPRPSVITPEESAEWLREFSDLDSLPETQEALGPDSAMITDEEIARIEREIDREFR